MMPIPLCSRGPCFSSAFLSHLGRAFVNRSTGQPLEVIGSGFLALQRRSFYSSRWDRRLKRLLEHRRYPPAPVIPDTEMAAPLPFYGMKPIRPVWSSRRCGVLAYKLGTMHIWDDWGERHPCTICQVDRCVVLEQRTLADHGYESLQLGLGYKSIRNTSKPNLGRYIKIGTVPKHRVAEFKCTSDCFLPVGHEMSVRHFTPGQWIFVSGWTKAKGYSGVQKKWGFAGQSESHGTDPDAKSGTGSIGQGHSVNLVWRFKKLPGHLGPDPRCVNAKVMRIETERNLIFLRGSLPGHKGQVVKLSDARGATWKKNKGLKIHYPTFIPDPMATYPVTANAPPKDTDPFLFPELQMNYE